MVSETYYTLVMSGDDMDRNLKARHIIMRGKSFFLLNLVAAKIEVHDRT